MILKRIHTILLLASLLTAGLACQRAQSAEQIPVAVPVAQQTISDTVITQPPVDTIAIPLDLDYIMGRFDPSKHPDFVLIDPQYADKIKNLLKSETITQARNFREWAEPFVSLIKNSGLE